MKRFKPACYRGQLLSAHADHLRRKSQIGGLAPGEVQAEAAKLLAVQALSNMKAIDRCELSKEPFVAVAEGLMKGAAEELIGDRNQSTTGARPPSSLVPFKGSHRRGKRSGIV